MRRTVSFALALLVAHGVAAGVQGASLVPASYFGAGAQVITFETGTTALPVVPGVVFENNSYLQNIPPSNYIGGDATFSNPITNAFFGNQYYGNLSGYAGYTSLAIDFTTPTLAVGAYVNQLYGDAVGSITTSVYNANGGLIGQTSTSFPPASTFPVPSPTFVGFADPNGIARIVFQPSSQVYFGIDNLTFLTPAAAVPEPSSYALAGAAIVAGLGCVLARLRRRPA